MSVENSSCSKPADERRGIIAVFIAPPLTEAFELTIARALDLKKEGATLRILYCDGTVAGCVANPFNVKKLCSHCRNVRDTAFRENFIGEETISIDLFRPSQNKHKSSKNEAVPDREEILRGVESTILTFYRIDVNRLCQMGHVRNLAFKYIAKHFTIYSEYVYRCLSNYLSEMKTSRLEFFNGRIVPTSAAMCAAIDAGVDFSVIEVSGAQKSMFLLKNASAHDLTFWKMHLRQYLNQGRGNQELGNSFFVGRRFGISSDARAFTGSQKPGYLNIDPNKQTLAIFTSSADEMQVSGEQWLTEASKDPVNFILDLRQRLRDEFRVIVRMHPNQHGDRTGKASYMISALSAVAGIELIRPLDKQSTYELIDIADYVLTFGSTVGLEATYWGKPSLLAGRAIWEDADLSYSVATVDDVLQLLKKNVKPHSRTIAINVGSFFMDEMDGSLSLSWGDGGNYGFHADGKSYLSLKRRSLAYYVSRAVDKVLRLNI